MSESREEAPGHSPESALAAVATVVTGPASPGDQTPGGEAKDRLLRLETVIQRGLGSFLAVGQALREIRDSGLYRLDHSSFENYCRARWGISRPRAYALMAGADVAASLPVSAMEDTSERAIRPLSRVPAELRPSVWDKAKRSAQGRRVQGRHVELAIVEVLGEGTTAAAVTYTVAGDRSRSRGRRPIAVGQQAKAGPQNGGGAGPGASQRAGAASLPVNDKNLGDAEELMVPAVPMQRTSAKDKLRRGLRLGEDLLLYCQCAPEFAGVALVLSRQLPEIRALLDRSHEEHVTDDLGAAPRSRCQSSRTEERLAAEPMERCVEPRPSC